jgi:hypothetical protein
MGGLMRVKGARIHPPPTPLPLPTRALVPVIFLLLTGLQRRTAWHVLLPSLSETTGRLSRDVFCGDQGGSVLVGPGVPPLGRGACPDGGTWGHR